jgi:hypothetical protein
MQVLILNELGELAPETFGVKEKAALGRHGCRTNLTASYLTLGIMVCQ